MSFQKQNYFQRRTKPKGPRTNERFRSPQVQVISSDGKNLGTLPTQEAINIANNSEYGLGGSIWTNNIELGTNMATQIETGAVFINDMTKSDPRLPFGGIKMSGYGRELSQYGMLEFVNIKTVVIKSNN